MPSIMTVRVVSWHLLTRHGMAAIDGGAGERELFRSRGLRSRIDDGEEAVLLVTTDGLAVARLAEFLGRRPRTDCDETPTVG